MIYVDTSVVPAQLLAEDRRPPVWLWTETLLSSRLMKYEVWTRLHARNLADSYGEAALGLIGRIAILELTPAVLVRAPDAFPESVAVRVKKGQSLSLRGSGWGDSGNERGLGSHSRIKLLSLCVPGDSQFTSTEGPIRSAPLTVAGTPAGRPRQSLQSV